MNIPNGSSKSCPNILHLTVQSIIYVWFWAHRELTFLPDCPEHHHRKKPVCLREGVFKVGHNSHFTFLNSKLFNSAYKWRWGSAFYLQGDKINTVIQILFENSNQLQQLTDGSVIPLTGSISYDLIYCKSIVTQSIYIKNFGNKIIHILSSMLSTIRKYGIFPYE